ncbi:MAG: hypothetical protein KF859_03890 [Phycisphaeraceae bacterium]|nr:hypothetical protein [Phycisphaeraceae bacterium]
MKVNKVASGTSALVLCMMAGAAMGQTATDGRITSSGEAALYGAPLWVNTTTTGFGDASPNTGTCDPETVGGDPAAVTTGIEIKIPLSTIGSPTGQIGISVFINGQGHDYASNQFLPSLPPNTGNLGGDGAGNYTGTVAGINLANFAGNQHGFYSPASAAVAPVVDGILDGQYGAPLALQQNRTRFGNSDNGLQAANGSELNALYMASDGENLYIFLSGNLQNNFNKLEVFLDTVAGGENTILADNADVDFNAINTRLAGLTFDAGFEPDYYITFGAGGSDPTTFYPNFADLNANTGGFLGCNDAGTGTGVLGGCGGPPANGIEVALDNTNIGGVDGPCPPAGGNADVANGSEFNALYAYIDPANNRLHVLITGNLENGFGSACDSGGNKINLFFDVDSTNDIGQNTIRPDNVDIAYGNLNRMAGLTFDEGFAANYWVSFKTGGDPVYQVLDAAVLRTDGRLRNALESSYDYGAYDGGVKANYNPVTFRGNFEGCNSNPDDPMAQDGFTPNIYTNYAPRTAAQSLANDPFFPVGTPGLIEASIDNSNIAGVQGTGGTVDGAASVTTGLEMSFDLDELGWDGVSCIKIAGFIANGDATYGSNQVIGGLPSQDFPNLGTFGNLSAIDFNTIEGSQYVVLFGDCGGGGGCGPCYADYNQDGGVDGSDVESFFIDWENAEGCSDVNEDGGVDGADVEAFFIQWEQGGCD